MEVPTKEQVYEKYIKVLYSKGYFKDCSEEDKINKERKAKEYFEAHYSKLERFPAVKIPKSIDDISEEKKAEAEALKANGNKILQSGDYATAMCEYTRAIELNPFNHIYYSNRSLCYCRLNDYELALRDADKCIELCPTFGKGYSRRVDALINLERYEEADKSIDKAISLEPENVNYLNTKNFILEHLEVPKKKEKSSSSEEDEKTKKRKEKERKKQEKEEKKRKEKEEKEAKKQQQSSQGGGFFGNLLSGLMNNPQVMNMAQSMMSNPQFMNMAQNMMSNPQMRNMAESMMSNPEMMNMAQNMAASMQQNAQNQENQGNPNGQQ